MKNKTLSLILLLVCIMTTTMATNLVQDTRQNCLNDQTLYKTYPDAISTDPNNLNHYYGYAMLWKWYNYYPNTWRAKYGALYEMDSWDKGNNWSCPNLVKEGPTQETAILNGTMNLNLGDITKYISLNYPKYTDIKTCDWNAQLTCEYPNIANSTIIYSANSSWNLDANPLIGYDSTNLTQKQFLVSNNLKIINRKYDNIYYPSPVKVENNIYLYFGGWKGENTNTLPICPKQGLYSNPEYKYCNCFKNWENQYGTGWWDTVPYDLCTGDKIYLATNKYSQDAKDFRAYSGNALNINDNSFAGPNSSWSSETWQPIIWPEALRNNCNHLVCKDAYATNDISAIRLPNNKFLIYFGIYRDPDKFPTESNIGIISVALSNDGIHFMTDPNAIKPLEANWPNGNYGYSNGGYSAVYDLDLNKIVMLWSAWNNQGPLFESYRLIIDPSNPYVAESITKLTSLKTIPTNPVCSQYPNTTYSQTQLNSFRTQWAQNTLSLTDFITKIRIWKYCSKN